MYALNYYPMLPLKRLGISSVMLMLLAAKGPIACPSSRPSQTLTVQAFFGAFETTPKYLKETRFGF